MVSYTLIAMIQITQLGKLMHKKIHLPTKVCPVCKLEFNWRKKWKKDWEQVIYCSEKCKRSKNSS